VDLKKEILYPQIQGVTVCSATCPARIARPTVGPADRWLTGQSGEF
jgi:hypothetical protein